MNAGKRRKKFESPSIAIIVIAAVRFAVSLFFLPLVCEVPQFQLTALFILDAIDNSRSLKANCCEILIVIYTANQFLLLFI